MLAVHISSLLDSCFLMRSSRRFTSLLFLGSLALVALPGRVSAEAIQLLSSDARGVTLRLEAPAPEFAAPDADGRSRLVMAGLDAAGEPGRPALPLAATLVALPPGARAVARVLEAGPEEVHTGVRLAVQGRGAFRDDGGKLGLVSIVEPATPLADGPWPASAVELGEPFTLRGEGLVAVHLRPVRYDEATGTVWSRRTLTVRVEFPGATVHVGGIPAGADRHWDSVLERAVINIDRAREWRVRPEPATNPALELLRRSGRKPLRSRDAVGLGVPAFDEDNPEVRAVVDTTGVYSLTYPNLSANGFPSGIPVAQLSVHRHEFVPGANPPYVTIELPIEVDDLNNDGVFNANDRIVVFVQNWAERSRVSIAQRAWGDAEVVFATYLTDQNGLRVTARSGWLDQSLTPLASYRTTAHFEQTGFYLPVFFPGVSTFKPFESDTTTDQFLWTGLAIYDRSIPQFVEFPFETNHLDNTRPATITVQWVGTKMVDHITWAEVRNGSNQSTAIVDSVQWPERITFSRGASVTGTALSEGRTNTLVVWGRDTSPGAAIASAGLNWFEVNYARRFRALSGRLSCNSDSATGDYQINATGFNSRIIRVYDVTDSLAPVRLTLADSLISTGTAPFTVRFQDTSPTGALRRYVMFDTPKVLALAKLSAVTRRSLSLQTPADYLLIAPEALLGPAQTLATHRRSQGLSVLVCPLESVNDEFNGGRKSTYSIRRLLQFAYGNWSSRFVLLMGDGSEDPLNQIGTAGPDLIPAQRIGGPVGIQDGSWTVYESVVSDPWYVWCLTCDGAPSGAKLQDMFIGRLPVATAGQASDVVSKLIAYDAVTPDDAWRRRMLILADDQFSTQSLFGGSPGSPDYCFKFYEDKFIQISQVLRDLVLNEASLAESDAEIFDLAEYLKNEPVFTDPRTNELCRQSWQDTQAHCHLSVTPQMFQRLNDGRLWWNFQGHANPFVLTHEDVYVNLGFTDDLSNFANDGKPFLFTAFSCHPNAFGITLEGDASRGPCLGEDMVNLPGKGAIASWGSVGYELIPSVASSHLNVHFARALFADPPRDPYLGQGGARAILGEVIELALMRNHAIYGFDQVGITYTLLGDPGTPISIGAPQARVTANALPVTSGDPVRLHTPGDTLRLDADLVSNVRLSSLAFTQTLDGATTTISPSAYTLTPAFPDSGAASSGGRRFHLTYRTSLAPDSYTFGLQTQDRYGVPRAFDAVFPFQTVLRADGIPVGPGERIWRGALLNLTVLSPSPLQLPQGLSVTINGTAVGYTPAVANGDTTGREWSLAIPRAYLVVGRDTLVAHATGGGTTSLVFLVDTGGDRARIESAYAFPNPFDEQRGTYFNFRLTSPGPADVQIRVYTVAGRLVYKRSDFGLLPGSYQIAWDGLDAEGQPLANGVYLYRVLARSGSSQDRFEGRLVKLRRPRRAEDIGNAP